MKAAVFHRLAERELVEAVEYYENERRGLGEELLVEIEGAIVFLDRYPEAAPRVGRKVRSCVLPRFPYSLIYRQLATGQIRILAVAHHKRRPQYWTTRR